MLMTKYCPRCEAVLPVAKFHRNSRRPDGRAFYCRKCMAKYQQWYYEDNPDKDEQRKRRQSEWQRNLSPEKKKAARLRALLQRHQLTPEELAALYQACGHRCQVCQLHASEHRWKGLSGQLCVDHILVDGKRVVRGLLCNRC